MRSAIRKAGLFLYLFILVGSGSAHAAQTDHLKLADNPLQSSEGLFYQAEKPTKPVPGADDQAKDKEEPPDPLPELAPTPEPPASYTVLPGDTLTKIADVHQTTWERLFAKNLQISDPNLISVGVPLTIPAADEPLGPRPLPVPQQVEPMHPMAASPTAQRVSSSSAGNTYAPGYCTWYAKNRRPDLPNQLGNANSWVAQARARGRATGAAPQAGAIGQQGNHVVYIEAVNGDGSVTVSEMNYQGLFIVSSRTAPAANFTYIY